VGWEVGGRGLLDFFLTVKRHQKFRSISISGLCREGKKDKINPNVNMQTKKNKEKGNESPERCPQKKTDFLI